MNFVHPSREDLTLGGVLSALSDPTRLRIVRFLYENRGNCASCAEAAPCPKMAKSTLSNHFRILREAGLIHTVKHGVEHRSVLRKEDINARFPGLLELILKLAE